MKPRSKIPIGLLALTLASIALALTVFWSFGGGGPGAAPNIQISDEGAQQRQEAAGVFNSLSPAAFAIFVLSLITTYWVGRQSSPLRTAGAGVDRGQLVDPSFLRARASLLAAIQSPSEPLNFSGSGPGSPAFEPESPAETKPVSNEEQAAVRPEADRSQGIDRIKRFAEAEDQPKPVTDEEPEQAELFGPPLILSEIFEGRRTTRPTAKNQGRRNLSSTGPLSGLTLESSLIFFDQTSLRVPPYCPVGTSIRKLIGNIKQISHSGRQLDRMVKTMDDFVFQANLLALEAAVESGRAGQSGRGLHTVAAKSRQLAIGSAEAARNTAELIASVQAQIESGMEKAQSMAERFIKPQPVEERLDELPRLDLKASDNK